MIVMFLAPGFEEVEALAPLDLLRRAGLSVTTVAVTASETELAVRGAHNITVLADVTAADFRRVALADPTAPIEAVILPGGMPGTTNLDASPVVEAALAMAHKQDAYLCAICAAPLVLGRRGLLKGLRATCYPGFEEELVGATTAGERVVTDQNVTTAIGMGAAEEFGRELCRLLCGEEKANGVLASIHAR